MAIIKREDAVVKSVVTLITIPAIWIYGMTADDVHKEEFSALKLVGIFVLLAGSVWYITADWIHERKIMLSEIGRIGKRLETPAREDEEK